MPRSNQLKISGPSIVLLVCCTLACVVLGTGCSTLSSLGFSLGGTGNKLLKTTGQMSEAPGRSLLLPKELAIAPMDQYIVEIADTLSIEPVSFEATIRLPGDQVVKPDGTLSLGEFGNYLANGKTVDQMKLEIQSKIDQQIRSEMEIEFAKQIARQASDDAQQREPLGLPALQDRAQDSGDSASDEADLAAKKAKRARERQKEARRLFEERLDEKLYQNRVSVRVTNWESKKIYVLGEVNSPGSFPFIGNETVLDAIIEAGGLGSSANRHSIVVSRPSRCSDCRTVIKVCYDQIVQLGDTSTNYQLMPGDRVFVPSLGFCDDLKQSFRIKDQPCPRCAGCDQACDLPAGCE